MAVAVSGGMDSVVLLDLLRETQSWHRGELSVVTVDHRTGPQSAEHAAWVEALARRWDVPCEVYGVDARDHSEGALRAARYALFDSLDTDVVAIAHHRDDQAATVILHAIRGTGIRGLAGMARRRDRYVRPLLDEPRSTLRAWAAHRGLSWMEDQANSDPRYLRNRLDAEVLPLLEAIRPGAVGALARTAGHAAAADRWLESEVDRLSTGPPWAADWLATGPRAVVRRALLRLAPTASAAQVDAVICASIAGRGRVCIGNVVLVVSDGEVVVTKEG